jgi:hypothetical protein
MKHHIVYPHGLPTKGPYVASICPVLHDGSFRVRIEVYRPGFVDYDIAMGIAELLGAFGQLAPFWNRLVAMRARAGPYSFHSSFPVMQTVIMQPSVGKGHGCGQDQRTHKCTDIYSHTSMSLQSLGHLVHFIAGMAVVRVQYTKGLQ